MRKIKNILIVLTVLSNLLMADQGRAGAQFLKIFPGVAGPAIGGASSIMNYSSEVVFWNPAGLNDLTSNSVFISHADYFVGIKYENFAVVMPMPFGTIAFHGMGLLSGDIRETTVEEPDGTGDYYSKNDYAFGAAYAMKMTNKFSMGVSGRILALTIDDLNAYGFAFDAGAKYASGLPGNLTFAFSIKNFGPNMSYSGEGLEDLKRMTDSEFEDEDVKYEYVAEDFPLPLSFSFAVSGEIPISERQKIGIALENWQVIDLKEIYRMGITWNYDNLFFISGGHANLERMFNPDIDPKDVNGNMQSWTFGGGLNLNMIFQKNFWIKYSWEAHEYFDGINRIGLDISF